MRPLAALLLPGLLAACSSGMDGMTAETGELSPRDRTLASGEYRDVYTVRLEPGQWITADVLSNRFDPYLILRDEAGEQVENDDAEARDRSRIVFESPQGGTYDVFVTSSEAGETGAYAVAWEITDEPPARLPDLGPVLPPGHPRVPGPPAAPQPGGDVLGGGVRI